MRSDALSHVRYLVWVLVLAVVVLGLVACQEEQKDSRQASAATVLESTATQTVRAEAPVPPEGTTPSAATSSAAPMPSSLPPPVTQSPPVSDIASTFFPLVTPPPLPEPGELVFEASGDRVAIYVSDADSSNPARLTSDEISGHSPVWSPDGRRIAFVQPTGPYTGGSHAWVVNDDGTGLTRLTALRPEGKPLVALKLMWSPDGQHVLYYDKSCGVYGSWGAGGVFLAEADGSTLVTIADQGEACASAAAWAPDGTKIAVGLGFYRRSSQDEGKGLGVFALEVEGGQPVLPPKPLVQGLEGEFVTDLHWSPDGQWITLQEDSGYLGLSKTPWIMKADGSELVAFVPEGLEDYNISSATWSPTGDQIAFAAQAQDEGPGSLWIADADSRASARRLTGPDLEGSVGSYRWSPDGQRVAVTLEKGSRTDLYLIDMDGENGHLRRLLDPSLSQAVYDYRWSPDGQRLVITLQGEDVELYVINADGSGLTRLTHAPWNHDEPVWSPDSQRVAWVTGRHSRAGRYRICSDGPSPTLLTQRPVPPAESARRAVNWDAARLSPDGRHIAFISGGALILMDPQGSERVHLVHDPMCGAQRPTWSPDSKRLAFLNGCWELGRLTDWPWRLEVIDVEARERRVLREESTGRNNLTELTWLPDGSGLSYLYRGVLTTIHLGTASVRQITDRFIRRFSWAPDEKRVVVEQSWPGPEGLFVMNADGTDRRDLTSGLQAHAPQWSPDGLRIAFLVGSASLVGNPGLHLYSVRPDGTGLLKLAEEVHPEHPDVTWSPDGRQVAFISSGGGCLRGCPPGFLYVVNIDGSGLRKLSDLWLGAILGWLRK